MDSKQQKQYDAKLDTLGLTDSQRDAFDHSAKRSLINLENYKGDDFSLNGYKLSKVMDDFVLAQFVDLSDDGTAINRNGILIPLAQVQRTWRLARVILAGPNCKSVKVGDVVCFPDDKGVKVSNITVAGFDDPLKDCLFLNEERFFGVCDQLD